jgi:selenocysteine lyase/cysteine desulfurase
MNYIGSLSRRSFIQKFTAGAALLAIWDGTASANSNFISLPKLSAIGSSPNIGEEEFWKIVRSQMMFQKDIIFLNNGSFGSTPLMVFDSVVQGFRLIAENPENIGVLWENMEEIRKKVANFIGASEDEIALTRSTTEGMSIVAAGLPLKRGDEVLISDHEHSGGTQPWLLRAARDGIEVREVKIPSPPESPEQILNLFNDAISTKTRVISLSHVTHAHGIVMPIKRLSKLAREKGILTVYDAAHTMGMFPLDMHDIDPDFYASSPHKWLDAPAGSGVFYVRKDKIDMLWPMFGARGWDKKSARRFEAVSSRAWPVTCALGTAIDFQSAIGPEKIEKRGRELATYFKERVREIPGVKLITSMDPRLSCSISSLSIENLNSPDISNYLEDKYRIFISAKLKLNPIRVSTHFYNTKEEVDTLLNAIKEIAEKRFEGLTTSVREHFVYDD